MAETIATSASLLVPLLALILVLVVDSVQEKDSVYYRIFVGGIGLASLGPILIVVLFSVLAPYNEPPEIQATIFTAVSLALIWLLLIGTTVREVSRGLNGERKFRFQIVLGAVVLTWYSIFYYIF